jgi:hypothetical protein
VVRGPGCNNLATDVDHVIAMQHGGNPYDSGDVQALCKRHHEMTGREVWGRKDGLSGRTPRP